MPVDVCSAPNEAKRAEPRLVEVFEGTRRGAEVLRPLEVEDRRQHALAQALLELACRSHDPHPSLGLSLQLEQDLDQLVRRSPGVDGVQRRRVRDLVAILGRGEGPPLAPLVLRVWSPAGEEAAAEAALPGAGKVEVAGVAPLEKGAPLPALRQMEIEQRVVVAVEDKGRVRQTRTRTLCYPFANTSERSGLSPRSRR